MDRADRTAPVVLEPALSVEILVLMDNFSDVLLPSTERAIRPPLAPGGRISATTLLAEHGLSLLVTVCGTSSTSRLVLDAGYSDVGLPHNLDLLGVDLRGVEALVLSHGHMDHFGALHAVVGRMRSEVPVVAHPAAFEGSRHLDRREHGLARLPDVPPELVAALEDRLLLGTGPYVSGDRLWATTGEVPRSTEFEKGMAGALRERGGRMVVDDLEDDLAVVIEVEGRGLVVIAGCAHAGIVNTVRHALDLTGARRLYALIGGFHLGGADVSEVVDPTVEAIRRWAPEVVVPMHCTGRAAAQRFEAVFRDAFESSSVGTTFRL